MNVVFGTLILGALSGGADVRTWKLGVELARGNLRQGDCAITPDGTWAVFSGQYEGTFAPFTNLYSAPADGSADPLLLFGPPERPEREDDTPVVGAFRLTSDSRRVVFAVDDDYQALYSAPVDGSAPALLLATASQLLAPFVLSPDGVWAVFATDGRAQLFSVRTDGSAAPVALASAAVPYSGDFIVFEVTPDGKRVVFTVDERDLGCSGCGVTNRVDLFSVPIDGSAAPTRLGLAPPRAPRARVGTPASGADEPSDVRVTDFVIAPDGARVVYATCEQDCVAATRLFVVPTAGGALPRRLFTGTFERPVIDVTGQLIVYRGDVEGGPELELLTQPLDGSEGPRRLHAPLASSGSITAFELSPDGRRVVFAGDPDARGQVRLFEVPSDGSAAPTKLLVPLVPGRDVRDFRVVPGGDQVVFRADVEADELFGLHAASLDRPSSGSIALTHATDVASFEPLSDGARVLFRAADGGAEQLFVVPLDAGTAPLGISGAEGASATHVDARATRVVYRGSRPHATDIHVYGAALDGSATPGRIDDPTYGSVFGDVESFELHPDGRRAVFAAGSRDFSFPEIYVASLGGARPPVLLEGLVPADGLLLDERAHLAVGVLGGLAIEPSTDRVVYQVRRGVEIYYASTVDVFSAPLDGSAPGVQISAPLFAGGATYDLALAGDRVVYRSEHEQSEGFELASAPVDGSAPPRILSLPLLVNQRGVTLFRVTPDGRRVVFAQGRDNIHRDLYTIRSDGVGPALVLPGSRVNGSTVGFFELTSDGTRVVFTADSTTTNVLELFVVPVDASGPAVRLHPQMPPGRNVTTFAVTPDSTRVVYVADHTSNNRFDLYVAPLDASAAPRPLIPAPATSQTIHDVRVDPSSTRAVFTPGFGGQTHLQSVPLDASAPPVELNAPLPAGGSVLPWVLPVELTPEWAVYVADQDLNDVFELYVVPLDGSASSHRVDTPFDSSSDRVNQQVAVAGGRVFFSSSLDFGAYVLYSAPLDGSTAPVRISPPDTNVRRSSSVGTVFRVDAAGKRVLFTAASESDFELYVGLLGGPRASTEH